MWARNAVKVNFSTFTILKVVFQTIIFNSLKKSTDIPKFSCKPFVSYPLDLPNQEIQKSFTLTVPLSERSYDFWSRLNAYNLFIQLFFNSTHPNQSFFSKTIPDINKRFSPRCSQVNLWHPKLFCFFLLQPVGRSPIFEITDFSEAYKENLKFI